MGAMMLVATIPAGKLSPNAPRPDRRRKTTPVDATSRAGQLPLVVICTSESCNQVGLPGGHPRCRRPVSRALLGPYGRSRKWGPARWRTGPRQNV